MAKITKKNIQKFNENAKKNLKEVFKRKDLIADKEKLLREIGGKRGV